MINIFSLDAGMHDGFSVSMHDGFSQSEDKASICFYPQRAIYIHTHTLRTRNMTPMEPKRHRDLHPRPPHLLKRPRVQHQQVTRARGPVQHHAQAHPRVLRPPAVRIRQEDGLPRRLGVHDARRRRPRRRVVLDQAVEEGRVAPVADAVDVAVRPRRALRVDAGQFGRVALGRHGQGAGAARGARRGDAGAADVGESEAGQAGFARGAFAVDVVARARGGAFHVVVVEALEDVEVRVRGDVGDDVDLPGFRRRGLLPRVDGVEGEEGLRFVHAHQAVPVPSVDHQPEVLPVRLEVHGVHQVPRPEDLGAVFGVVGGEDAEDHVALRQEDRMEVRRPDRSAGESGEDGRFPRLGGHGEDSVRWLSTHFEVVVVPISGDGVRAGVGAREGSFEVRVEFRLAHGVDRFQGRGVDALEGGVVGFEPEVVDLWGRIVL